MTKAYNPKKATPPTAATPPAPTEPPISDLIRVQRGEGTIDAAGQFIPNEDHPAHPNQAFIPEEE